MERTITSSLSVSSYTGNYFNVFKGFHLGDFDCKRRVLDGLAIEFSLIRIKCVPVNVVFSVGGKIKVND